MELFQWVGLVYLLLIHYVTSHIRHSKILKPFFHDSSKGERLFPGLGNIFLLTITTQFAIPFYRDYLMGLGLLVHQQRILEV